MQSANNPENQQQQGARGSVQINLKETDFNPVPWVVVEKPGQDDENIVADFATLREAYRFIDRNYTEDECDADVMRRLDDGTLTTDF